MGRNRVRKKLGVDINQVEPNVSRQQNVRRNEVNQVQDDNLAQDVVEPNEVHNKFASTRNMQNRAKRVNRMRR
ncbi:MAG: hypothetical protein ABIA04_09065 [Pseudomonadota bacterium]